MHEDSPEDMVHDLFTEALVARTPARAARPRARRTRSRRRPAIGARLLPASLRARAIRGGGRRQRAARRAARHAAPSAWTPGGRWASGGRSAWNLGDRHRAPEPRRQRADQAHARPSRRTSARHERPRPHRPRPVRVPHRERARSAAGCPRGCSRRSARSVASPTRCTATTRSTRRRDCSARYAGTTPARAARGARTDPSRARRTWRDGGITPEEFDARQGPREGLARPVARGSRRAACRASGKSEISHGEILTRERDAAARAGRDLGGCASCGRAGTVAADDAHGAWGPFGDEGVARGRAVIRVGVIGAAGRMGREVCRAVAAADDLELVAAVDRREGIDRRAGSAEPGSRSRADELDELLGAEVEVAVDFTHPSTVMPNVRWCLEQRGAHGRRHDGPHAGRSGGAARRGRRRARPTASSRRTSRSAPCCCCGSRPRRRRYFAAAEVIELHHDGKADAPSGTAIATARAIAAARAGDGPRPRRSGSTRGRAAPRWRACGCTRCACRDWSPTKRCMFGGPGQTLSLRHDAVDRAAFMPGVLLAIRAVADRPGLTVGLDALLD